MTIKEALRILLEYAALGESEFGANDPRFEEAYNLIKKNLDEDDRIEGMIDALGLRHP